MMARHRGLACGMLAWPAQAAAHGFGARYDLPLPLTYYITGAGLAIVVSFAVLASWLRPVTPTSTIVGGHGHALSGVLPLTRLAGVTIYLLVVCTGLFGVQAPLKNIAPVLVWAAWWVGLAYVSAFIANVWVTLNPIDALFAWGEATWRSRGRRRRRLHYPDALGVWPAVVLFVVFAWMEIVWDESDQPRYIALALLAYSVLTWIAMALFGRERWLQSGEVFTLVFGLLARFAPVQFDVQRTSTGRDRVHVAVQPYVRGLLVREPLDRSHVALVMVLLAAVSFDGFVETPAWAAVAELMEHPALLKTAGLLLAPCVFLAVFVAVCGLSVRLAPASRNNDARGQAGTWRVAGLFATTLVPIAIAYHVAHYLSFLALAWQYLVVLASDPFGWGWDLFGTTTRFVRPGWVDARMVWNVSVTAIVLGHVAAIYLAHVQALREFGDVRAARRSQYPMLALMVAYTMLSLWIIAQPIVSTR